MTDNKQAPREVWCGIDGDRTDWGIWTGVRRTDEQDRLDPYGPPVVPVRYIRADVAAELARECLFTGVGIGELRETRAAFDEPVPDVWSRVDDDLARRITELEGES